MKESKRSFGRTMKSLFTSDKYGSLIIVIVMCIIMVCSTDKFLTTRNMMSLLRQASFYIMAAVGTLCVFMCGGIDLSVGGTMGVAGLVCAMLAKEGSNIPIALVILMGMTVGAVIGAVNGFLIGYLRFPAFIATLGMSIMLGGLKLIMTSGYPINGLRPEFTIMGTGYLLGIPIPIYIMLMVCVVAWLYLSKTKAGRHLCATGGNEQAALVSGINTKRTKMTAYIICNIFAALSGIVLCARFSTGQLSLGSGYELDAIAGAVIGGASMMGGYGTVLGVFFGTLVISIMRNGMDLLAINAYWQEFAQGVIIILAVLLDIVRQRMKKNM